MSKRSDKIKQTSVSDGIRVAILREIEDGNESIVDKLEEINQNTDPENNISFVNTFSFTDGNDHNATLNEISDPIDTPNNLFWNVTPVSTGVSGNSQYTIEVSNDGVSWFDYTLVFTNVSNEDAVEHDNLTWSKMRINHKAGSATGGTVRYVLTQID